MRTVIEMAREAGLFTHKEVQPEIERFAELVRADEREQGQRWFDAVTAQHKQAILAEREACAKVCEQGLAIATSLSALDDMEMWGEKFAAAIRARSNT